MKCDKKNYRPRNYKGISENTFKKRYANQYDHSTSMDIKTIRDCPSTSGG